MTKILIEEAVVQQALEALDRNWDGCVNSPEGEAITALRTAIEQADRFAASGRVMHEPVAWMFVNSDGECEQIEYGAFDMDDQSSVTLLYTTPPAAQRQPLTDEEIELLSIKHAPPIHPDFTEDDDFIDFARAIESAHVIKGEA